MSLRKQFAERLIEFRRQQKLSQADLARIMETSSGNVCDYEKGRKGPSLNTIERFAEALDIEPVEFFQ